MIKPDKPEYEWHPLGSSHRMAEPFGYNLGTAVAYLYRASHKAQRGELTGNRGAIADLEKAITHIHFEIMRLKGRAPEDEQEDES